MSESIFLLHPVGLIPQSTATSCWAAAASMLFGDRSVGPGDARMTGDSLVCSFENIQKFARSYGLKMDHNTCLRIRDLRKRLRYGPVMIIAEDERDAHAVVLVGMWGDGSSDGTVLLIYDPMPVGVGDKHPFTYAKFSRLYHLKGVYFLYR